jgi:D-psicose/D-tagatose/L-ribulose 3-epimerase
VSANDLSIHSYVWIPRWSTELGRIAAERAAAAGFDRMVVPLTNQEAIDPPAIARMFEDFGLKPVNTSNQRPDADISSLDPEIRARGLERHRHSLRLARDMGATHVGGVLYGLLGKALQAASSANMDAAAESLGTLAADAKRMGIRLAVEIVNRYESNLINTVAQALALVRLSGSDNIYVHLDTFHMNIEEDDLFVAIQAALPHLAYFELDQNHRGRPDRGAIDLEAMLAKLLATGYSGIIGVEAFSRAVTGADVAAVIGIWRDMYSNGDEVASSAAALIRRAQAKQPASPPGTR